MEPNKFEDNIKDKLEKRIIKPSENAWSTLSERLDSQVEKRHIKPYWWLGIAASVVGILFVISNVMNNDLKIDDTPKVVETDKGVESIGTINLDKKAESGYADSNIEKAVIEAPKESLQKPKSEGGLNIKEKEETSVAVINENMGAEEKNIKVADVDIINESLTFEEQKIKDVVAQVQTLKSENKTVTSADIDALLIEAQKEIALNRLYNETHGTVDANALLQDVENELDQSFRSKVFEAIKASYNTVKTTVAQRND
jgi:hypothetical protein